MLARTLSVLVALAVPAARASSTLALRADGPPAAAPAPRAPDTNASATASLARAKELLEKGEARQALDAAEIGLEWSPDDVDLLDVASRAAQKYGDLDKGLWYAALAQAQVEAQSAQAARAELVADLAKRVAELDPLAGKDKEIVGGYAKDLLALGQDCSSKKLWLNAVELLGRCGGTASKVAADAALDKLYKNEKAVQALLDSGFDVPIKVKQKRSPADVAKEDAKHKDWANAWQFKGNSYTVITNIGHDLGEQMSLAMEQMNAFYRKLFHVKEHGGGNTARVTIKVYATRAEFDADEEHPEENVQGFFMPGANFVVTYDPRSKEWPLSELWSTLFHEASHQFTHLISADLIPGWLNEGTASYFEGARLLPNGSVETNLVPESRLRELKEVFDAGKPSLKDVVSFYQPGSYEGEYYPVGWALVYFLQNYENDKSERVYQPLYQDYIASYKSGGKHDVLGRFTEYFVTKAKEPGVATFTDFEARWRKWMLDLHDVYFGPPSKADVLIARAQKQVANKKYDAAVETYRWALRKRPGDALAWMQLSDALAGLKQTDAALHAVHEALESARTMPDGKAKIGDTTVEALVAACTERARKLNKDYSDKRFDADARFVAAATAAAKDYATKELPLAGARLIDSARATFGDAAPLTALRAEILAKSGIDPRRWRRLPIAAELPGWDVGGGWKAGDGELAVERKSITFAFYEGELPERYRFEALVDTSGVDPAKGLFGLLFGVNDTGLRYFGGTPSGSFFAGILTKEGFKDELEVHDVELGNAEVRLAFEVTRDGLEFYVDDKKVGEKTYSAEERSGRIGLVLQTGKAVFREVRLKY